MEFLLILLLIGVGFIIRACPRGIRKPGFSWFDIPHASNREARRKRR